MNYIKTLRSEFNLTQAKLSEITGIPLRTIQNWDSGQRKPAEYVVELIRFKLEHIER